MAFDDIDYSTLAGETPEGIADDGGGIDYTTADGAEYSLGGEEEIDYTFSADDGIVQQQPALKPPETFLGMKLPEPEFNAMKYADATNFFGSAADPVGISALAQAKADLKWATQPYTADGKTYDSAIEYVFENFKPYTQKEMMIRLQILYNREKDLYQPLKQAMKGEKDPFAAAMGAAGYVPKQVAQLASPTGILSVIDSFGQMIKGAVSLPLIITNAEATYATADGKTVHPVLDAAIRGNASDAIWKPAADAAKQMMESVGDTPPEAMQPKLDSGLTAGQSILGAGIGTYLDQFGNVASESLMGPAKAMLYPAEQMARTATSLASAKDGHGEIAVKLYMEDLEKKHGAMSETTKALVKAGIQDIQNQSVEPFHGATSAIGSPGHLMVELKDGEYKVSPNSIATEASPEDLKHAQDILNDEVSGISNVTGKMENVGKLLVEPWVKMYKDITQMPEFIAEEPGDFALTIATPFVRKVKALRAAETAPVTKTGVKGWLQVKRNSIVKALQQPTADKVLNAIQENTIAYFDPTHTWAKIGKVIQDVGGKTKTGQLMGRYFTNTTRMMVNKGFKAATSIMNRMSSQAQEGMMFSMEKMNAILRLAESKYEELGGDAPFTKESLGQVYKQLVIEFKNIYKAEKEGVPLTAQQKSLKDTMKPMFRQAGALERGLELTPSTIKDLRAKHGDIPISELMGKEFLLYIDKVGTDIVGRLDKFLDSEQKAMWKRDGDVIMDTVTSKNYQNKVYIDSLKQSVAKMGDQQLKQQVKLLKGGPKAIERLRRHKGAITDILKETVMADNIADLQVKLGEIEANPGGGKAMRVLRKHTAGAMIDMVDAIVQENPAAYAIADSKAKNIALLQQLRQGIVSKFLAHAKEGKHSKRILKRLDKIERDMIATYDAPATSLKGMTVQGRLAAYKENPSLAKNAIVNANRLIQEYVADGAQLLQNADMIGEGFIAAVHRFKKRKTKMKASEIKEQLGEPKAKEFKEIRAKAHPKAVESAMKYMEMVQKETVRAELVGDALMMKLDQRPEIAALKAADPNGYNDITGPLLLSDFINRVYYDSDFALHSDVRKQLDSMNHNIADTPATIAYRHKRKGLPGEPTDKPFADIRYLPAPLDFLEGMGKKMAFAEFEAVTVPLMQGFTWVANEAFKRDLLGDVFIKNIGEYLPSVNKSYQDAIANIFSDMNSEITGPIKGNRIKRKKNKVAPENKLEDLALAYISSTTSLITDIAKSDMQKAMMMEFPDRIVMGGGKETKIKEGSEGGPIRSIKEYTAKNLEGDDVKLNMYEGNAFTSKYENALHKHGSYMSAVKRDDLKVWFEDANGNVSVRVPDVEAAPSYKAGKKVGHQGFGELAGKIIPVELFDYINGTSDPFAGLLRSYMPAKFLAFWKQNKVVWEPKAHFRNFFTNLTLAAMAGYATDMPALYETVKSFVSKKERYPNGELTPYGMVKSQGILTDSFLKAETMTKDSGLSGIDPVMKVYGSRVESGWSKAMGKVSSALGLDKMSMAYGMSEAVFKAWHMQHIKQRLGVARKMYSTSKTKKPFRDWAKEKFTDQGINPLYEYWRKGKVEGTLGEFVDGLYGADKSRGVPSMADVQGLAKMHAENWLLNYNDMAPAVKTMRGIPSLFMGNAFISWQWGMFQTMRRWTKHNPMKGAAMMSMARSMDIYNKYSDMMDPLMRSLMFMQKGDAFNRVLPLSSSTVMYNGKKMPALDVLKLQYYDPFGLGSLGLWNLADPNSFWFLSMNSDPAQAPGTKIMSWITDAGKNEMHGQKGLMQVIAESVLPSWAPFGGGFYMNELLDAKAGKQKPGRPYRTPSEVFSAMALGWKTDKISLHKSVDTLKRDYAKAQRLLKSKLNQKIKSAALTFQGEELEKAKKDAALEYLTEMKGIVWLMQFNRYLLKKGLNGKSKFKIAEELDADKGFGDTLTY